MPHNTNINIELLINDLQVDCYILLDWFDNFFKLNADKCKLLLSMKKTSINIAGENIVVQKSVKLLGIQIDNNLDFNEHIEFAKKATQNLRALARVAHLLSKDRLQLLMKAFVEFQFAYYPLV